MIVIEWLQRIPASTFRPPLCGSIVFKNFSIS